MHNLREMPLVRVFLVALVVLFVCGAGVGDTFARMEMQNGHEGDPEDGLEVIGGGGGDFEQITPVFQEPISKPILLEVNWIVQPNGSQIPIFTIISIAENEDYNFSQSHGTFVLVEK